METTNRAPTEAEIQEYFGLAMAMLIERRPDLVDEGSGLLHDGPHVEAVIRRQVVALADAHRARAAA